jgi:hypothetical protein
LTWLVFETGVNCSATIDYGDTWYYVVSWRELAVLE